MNSKLNWLAAACVMLASACDESPSYDGASLYKVTGVLDPSRSLQHVFVGRYVNLDVIDGEYELDSIRTTVSGAMVEIAGDGGTTLLEEESPGQYTDRYAPMNLTDGGRYDLRVLTRDGSLLRARTVIPKKPSLIDPPDTVSFRIKVDSTVHSYWNGTDSVFYAAYHYVVSWQPPVFRWAADSAACLFSFSIVFNDTVFYGADTVAVEDKLVDTFWNPASHVEYGEDVLVYPLAIFRTNVPSTGRYVVHAFSRTVAVDRALAEGTLGHIAGISSGSNMEGGRGFFGSRNESRHPILVIIDVIHEQVYP